MQEAAGALGALVLALIGSPARRGELLSALSRLANDEMWSVRRACADALGAMVSTGQQGPIPGAALPLVLALCRDPSSWVRGAALMATGALLGALPPEDCTQGECDCWNSSFPFSSDNFSSFSYYL
jgi:HEAT repeat protein